jgi:hypothetical protein
VRIALYGGVVGGDQNVEGESISGFEGVCQGKKLNINMARMTTNEEEYSLISCFLTRISIEPL